MAQIELYCAGDVSNNFGWTPREGGIGDAALNIRSPPDANFSTQLQTSCQLCTDRTGGDVTHCSGNVVGFYVGEND